MKAYFFAAVLPVSVTLAWSPPERVDRRPDNYVVYYNDIAVGPDGTPHVVWSECPRETYFEMIKYARRDHDTWTVPVNISRDSGDLRQPTIVVDSAGVPLVVWTEAGSGRVRYVRFLGDTWSVPKLCFSTRGMTPKLAIDSRDRIHLLFENLGRPGVIWYSYYVSEADSWARPCTVAFAPFELGWSDITVDRQDHLHAVWMSWATLNIEYSFNDKTGWTAPEQVPNLAPGTQAGHPRVATDTFNQPHVVWMESRVYYSWKNGDTWTAARRLDEHESGYPLIGSDSLNQLHIIWVTGDWPYRFGYVVRRDTMWFWSETLDFAGLSNLTVRHGYVHLAFRPRDFCLYYTRNPVVPGVEEGRFQDGPCYGLRLARITRGEVMVNYELEREADVSLEVFDITGRRVCKIGPEHRAAGRHTVPLPVGGEPGVRLVRLNAGSEIETVKAVIVR